MAHRAIDTAEPFTQWIVSRVRTALETHRAEAGRLAAAIASGRAPELLGVTVTATDPGLLASQMMAHLGHTEAADEIVREASCDLLACVALLTMKTGHDVPAPDYPALDLDMLRQIGDLLALGLRGSRLLMAKSALAQIAGNLARNDDPSLFDAPFSQMMARAEIGVNLVVDLFHGLALQCAKEGFSEQDNGPTRFAEAFLRDIEIMLARSNQFILEPIETLARRYSDPDAYASKLATARARRFGKAPVSGRAWQQAFDALAGQFPI